MKRFITAAVAVCVAFAAQAADNTKTMVTYDENGNINPTAAAQVISNCTRAVVAVDIANARATILTNTIAIANQTIDRCNTLLDTRTDYSIVSIHATGLTALDDSGAAASSGVVTASAEGGSATDSEGEILIVDAAVANRGTTTEVTITWQYVTGKFNSPKIIAASALDGSEFTDISMSDPVQVTWGDGTAWQAVAYVDNATFGSQAFFKITAELDTPVDDGKVFDAWTDGTDYTIDLVPSKKYRLRIISGRITEITEL